MNKHASDTLTGHKRTGPVLQGHGISKSFSGVRALKNVSFILHHGEVLALIGENGAGKSTLMKILAGVQPPDSGQVLLDGRKARIDSPRAAMDRGIALIHQELNLADNLDIGANIFLGREPKRFGVIDHKMIRSESRRYLDMVGLSEDPNTVVSRLSIGKQQLVEIAKALSIKARIIIMDEPTSSLSAHETDCLFKVVRNLRSQGISVIYISHRLGEVKELADRVTVLRDGNNAGDLRRDEILHDRMVRMMVGRDVSRFYTHVPHPPGKIVLSVEGLRTQAYPAYPINLSVRAGEIVGLAGLVGAGRTELLQAIFGAVPLVDGKITVDGQTLSRHLPIDAIDTGLALVPEDRKSQGLVLDMSVMQNAGLASVRRFQRVGLLNRAAERRVADDSVRSLNIKTPNRRQIVRFLSGGNQQKVVIAKWLATQPKILLLDEPTRGIDIGAKEEIYRLMEDLSRAGVGILFVSSEMEEVLGLSDRALVMHEGRLMGELSRSELSEEAVMRLATGRARRGMKQVRSMF